jgi:hypothetical protein
MKKILLIVAFCAGTAGFAIAQDREDKQDKNKTRQEQSLGQTRVPQTVSDKFTQEYSSVSSAEWSKDGENFGVLFTQGDQELYLVYDKNGNLKEKNTAVSDTEIPMSISSYLVTNYPNYSVKGFWRSEDGTKVRYKARLGRDYSIESGSEGGVGMGTSKQQRADSLGTSRTEDESSSTGSTAGDILIYFDLQDGQGGSSGSGSSEGMSRERENMDSQNTEGQDEFEGESDSLRINLNEGDSVNQKSFSREEGETGTGVEGGISSQKSEQSSNRLHHELSTQTERDTDLGLTDEEEKDLGIIRDDERRNSNLESATGNLRNSTNKDVESSQSKTRNKNSQSSSVTETETGTETGISREDVDSEEGLSNNERSEAAARRSEMERSSENTNSVSGIRDSEREEYVFQNDDNKKNKRSDSKNQGVRRESSSSVSGTGMGVSPGYAKLDLSRRRKSSGMYVMQSDVPSVIVYNFQRMNPVSVNAVWNKEQCGYSVIYSTPKKESGYASFCEDGSMIDSQMEVSESSVPSEMKKHIKKNHKGYKTMSYYKTGSGKNSGYMVELSNGSGEDQTLYFDSKGKMMKNK